MAYTNILLGAVNKKISRLAYVLIYIVAWALIWEGIGPLINKKSVFDWYDIPAYALGALIYWGMKKLSNRSTAPKEQNRH